MTKTDHRITKVLPRATGKTPADAVADADAPVFAVLEGTQIGRYELIYLIASGGMASVYAGRLVGMAGFERLVAVKVIHPHLSKEPSFIQMFLDEARLAAGISHPNVAEIYEVGEERGVYYMVGELVRGKDLRQVIEKAIATNTPLPRNVMASAIAQICDGLHEAHTLTDTQGEPYHLIHRDVSTRNILISYKGHPKLIDFGAAWAKTKLAHTTNGMIKGKVGYMPPEQLRGEPIDHRADIYALGVVLYTVTVGRHPFPFENEGEQITKALQGEFTLPTDIVDAFPPKLERIILRAMETDVNKRFATMAEMKHALLQFLSSSRTSAHESPEDTLLHVMTQLFAVDAEQESERIQSHRSQKKDAISALSPKAASTGGPAVSNKKRSLALRLTAAVLIFAGLLWLFALIFRTPSYHPTGSGQPTSSAADEGLRPHTPTQTATESIVGAASPEVSDASNDTARIYLDGLLPEASLWIGGKEVSSPIFLPRSTLRTIVEVRAPGFDTMEISVVPKSDAHIQVEQPRQKSSRNAEGFTEKTNDTRIRRGRFNKHISSKNNPSSAAKASPNNALSFEANPFQSSTHEASQ
ncbi:MAG: serine/threonine protein kinase [Deltaproteobacteria bacterium]|nr:serine/threonine protein kinase [Deltaproteobacteria bacterium]MBN2674497.1 serine/threonine protein kinase [Deltaproteobacteria bacterium]